MRALEQALGGPAIEVVAKATRRQFTLEYKRKIVREADGCKTPGAIGALLRREGLYSSHLTLRDETVGSHVLDDQAHPCQQRVPPEAREADLLLEPLAFGGRWKVAAMGPT